jgi:hypothetical protein
MFSVNRILNQLAFLCEAKLRGPIRDMQASYSAEPGSNLFSKTRYLD